MNYAVSKQLFEKAKNIIPGGVNSPVRAFKNVEGVPIFLKQGQGAYIIDVDDNKYIDYVCSWGAIILGHCHPKIIDILNTTILQGTSFGAPTLLEIQLAEKITKLMPSIEQIRMVNSGTEATMTAIRLARGYTEKNKIIKFNGCYHGHNDSLLVNAGSGILTLDIPKASGIPQSIAADTIVIEFNDLQTTKHVFAKYSDDIAAIIVEPIAGNMGLILPNDNFLIGLRALCDKYHSVLIFDEVMTGFRVSLGGAQKLYNIIPDLTTLGKIIGGGLPIGAVGGKTEIMSCLAPVGNVYQAGTLSGNPLVMAAGLSILQELETPDFYKNLHIKTTLLINGLKKICNNLNIKFHGNAIGGMFSFCFNNATSLSNYNDIKHNNNKLFNKFFHNMLNEGIYFAPSAFESGFISQAHTIDDINITLEKTQYILNNLMSARHPDRVFLREKSPI